MIFFRFIDRIHLLHLPCRDFPRHSRSSLPWIWILNARSFTVPFPLLHCFILFFSIMQLFLRFKNWKNHWPSLSKKISIISYRSFYYAESHTSQRENKSKKLLRRVGSSVKNLRKSMKLTFKNCIKQWISITPASKKSGKSSQWSSSTNRAAAFSRAPHIAKGSWSKTKKLRNENPKVRMDISSFSRTSHKTSKTARWSEKKVKEITEILSKEHWRIERYPYSTRSRLSMPKIGLLSVTVSIYKLKT